jgi:hypothetical protein
METKHRGPVKGTKYSRYGRDFERGWKTYRAIGEIEGLSGARVMVIINGALRKIAGCVFEDIHNKQPSLSEMNDLIKDEDFQEAVSEALEVRRSIK